jgi:hypothetical protein
MVGTVLRAHLRASSLMLTAFAALAMPRLAQSQVSPTESKLGTGSASGSDARDETKANSTRRFELMRPLPTLPGIMTDMELDGRGLAQQIARARGLQARILWVDCTANIERYNTEEKVVALMQRIKSAGFNTVVFDVKPISGQVAYPSKIAPKLEEWKGRKLPKDFDALKPMVREAKANGLSFFVSLNAFSEGHRDFKVGPGYDLPDQQTVLYEPQPLARIGDQSFPVSINTQALAPSDDELAVFTDSSKLPPAAEGRFAISINADGMIVDGFEFGGSGPRTPTIPRGGCVLVGDDRAAQWLRDRAIPGRPLAFDSSPLYVKISERPDQQIPLMMNPNNGEVQARALSIVKELAANYPIDGLVYDDRLRYAGLNADFSELTRGQFEKFVGKPVAWPDDVFKYRFNPDFTRGIVAGKYFQHWLTFRASTLRDFVDKVRKTLTAIRPKAQLGVYAGSWYGEYSNYGANYGAPDLDAGFWYLNGSYRQTGFAPLLDFLITGCYYTTPTIHDALATGAQIGYTVEYAGYLSNQVARDQTWTYAGIMLSQYPNDPDGFASAVQAACGSTQGVMVFDLSHEIEKYWEIFERGFSRPAIPPHARPDLLKEVRAKRLAVDKIMWKKDPVVIAAGQMRVGH